MDDLTPDQQRRRAGFRAGRLDTRALPPVDEVKVDGEVYELVGDEERVDRDWENENAKSVRENWAFGRAQRHRDLEAQRRTMSPGMRLDVVIARIEPDGLPAKRLHAVRRRAGSDHDQVGPPRPGGHEAELRERLKMIDHHVRMAERILDEQRGLLLSDGVGDSPGNSGGMAAGRLMTTAERDRIVWDDFQGVRSEVIAQEAPYLGTSARTIERARVAEAERRGVRVKPVTGEVLGPVVERRRAA